MKNISLCTWDATFYIKLCMWKAGKARWPSVFLVFNVRMTWQNFYDRRMRDNFSGYRLSRSWWFSILRHVFLMDFDCLKIVLLQNLMILRFHWLTFGGFSLEICYLQSNLVVTQWVSISNAFDINKGTRSLSFSFQFTVWGEIARPIESVAMNPACISCCRRTQGYDEIWEECIW